MPQNIRLDRREIVGASEQLAEFRSEPRSGPPPERFDVLAQKLRLETRNQPLGELADAPAAFGKPLPLGFRKELEYRRMIAGRRLPEVQVRHGGRPGRDVGGQQRRILHQSIDERALAGLDLPHHRDPAHLLLENASGFVDEGLPGGLENGCERLSASEQLLHCR